MELHDFTGSHGDEAVYQRNRERAVVAYAAMQRYFYEPDSQLYRGTINDSTRAFQWPFSQAVAATLALAGMGIEPGGAKYRDEIQRRMSATERYFNRRRKPPGYDSAPLPPHGPGGDLFYDDNAWTGLNMIQTYRLTGDPTAFRRAGLVFDLLASGWDVDAAHPAPGGVFWTMAPWSKARNTVSTAPSAELALHLCELSTDRKRRADYLAWATRMHDWVVATLQAPNGLFWDNIDLDGNIDRTQWSYNQGTMLGANVLLSRVTGDMTYLDRAKLIADTALRFYGADDGFFGQPMIFNAIFFKNLLLLEAEQHDPRYIATMQSYVDRAWDTLRDPTNDLFSFSQSEQLLDQAAMVQLLAWLAWDPARYAMLA